MAVPQSAAGDAALTASGVSDVSRWEAFFQGTEYMQRVREVADLYPEVRSVNVKYDDLDRFDADLAASLLEHPDLYLLAGKQAMKNLMHQDMRGADIAVRVDRLPRDARVNIRDLRGKYLGRLVSFEALVTRATQVKSDVRIGRFKCLRCGHTITQEMEGQHFSEPMECAKEQDGCGRSAASTRFKFLPDMTVTQDIQKIECQEPLENARGGTSPARVTVWLTGELAGAVSAGNRVIVNGMPKMVRQGNPPKSTIMETDVDAVSVEVQGQEFGELEICDEDRERIEAMARSPLLYQDLIASISPSIRGYEMEKAGLLLQLFGGVPKVLDDGTRLRGDIHILLVGDPGVAKSAMVRYMSRLAPRGVFASGKSSSAAGLTCAATKDGDWGEGRWTLEAGAMVLADNGFLGVDELDKMKDEDRSSMHEGMEQQQIHYNKAGIAATLQTRCSILAAMNPEDGRFDGNRTLVEQLDIPDTLVSRFDAIFLIQDRPNVQRDTDISGHILQSHRRGGALANIGEEGMAGILQETEEVAPRYDAEIMRKYVAYARRIKPVLTVEAIGAIQQHYVGIRKLGEGDDKAVPITARQLEGYVRMAEASARSRLSRWVQAQDAKRAIDVVEYYLNLFTPTNGGLRDIDAVMAPMPKNKRDKVRAVLDIIRTGGSEGISIMEVCEVADEKLKLDEDEVKEMIQKLLQRGSITEVDAARGVMKVVK
jgi:replicative DNA helicase Mcm